MFIFSKWASITEILCFLGCSLIVAGKLSPRTIMNGCGLTFSVVRQMKMEHQIFPSAGRSSKLKLPTQESKKISGLGTLSPLDWKPTISSSLVKSLPNLISMT